MISREDRTRALLEAAAREHDVDTTRLWSRLESELERVDARPQHRTRPGLLVAAAAAATVGVVGATVWASGWGDRMAKVPVAPSTGVVSTSTPRPTTAPPSSSAPTDTTSPTSIPPSPATPTAPAARRALSTSSLLVAADYAAAGWVADSVQKTQGWGQAAISVCQHEIPPQATQPGFPEPFRADGYPAAFGLGLAAYQYTFEFGTTDTAGQVLNTILAWPEGCGARVQESITSSPVQSVGLPGGREGHWYTLSGVQTSGNRHDELIAVVQDDTRVSLVVLHESGRSAVIDRVDATELLTRALDRLG